MIDVHQQINAVRRQFGSRTLDAGEARVVTITQEFDAEVDDVWDAVTNPERLPRWFLPRLSPAPGVNRFRSPPLE